MNLPILRPEHDNPLYEIYDDPATPWWGRALIREGLQRDPVDVAIILDVIATAFRTRADAIIHEHLEGSA